MSGHFVVTANMKKEDRTGRGTTLADALKTLGPLKPRLTLVVSISWRGEKGDPGIMTYGKTLQEAMEFFIEEALKCRPTKVTESRICTTRTLG